MSVPVERLTSEGRGVIDAARQAAQELGVRVALVGGAVRDLILGVEVRDLDLVAEGDADRFAARLGELLSVPVHSHERFLTFRLPVPGLDPLDVVTARRETYSAPGALPTVTPSTIEHDLARRDFTINCIAWDVVEGTLLDPMEGLRDLHRGELRILHSHSFTDDPTRLLRLLRLAARFGFSIEAGTRERMAAAIAARELRSVSLERTRREVEIAFEEEAAPAIIDAFAAAGLLDQILPGPHPDRLMLQRVQDLASGAGADVTTALLAALHPDDLCGKAVARLWGPARAAEIIRIRRQTSALSRLLGRSTSPIRHALAITRVESEALVLIAAARTHPDLISARRKADTAGVSGRVVRATGVEGPAIGRILRLTRAAVAAGLVDEENADQFARERALKYLSTRRRS